MLTQPPPISPLRALYDAQQLKAPRKLPSFEQAKIAAQNLMTRVDERLHVNSLYFDYGDGCVYLARFTRIGSHTILHNFGKS